MAAIGSASQIGAASMVCSSTGCRMFMGGCRTALWPYKVSDTTVRTRRDEWIEAGVYDAIANEAIPS
ncbi:MAG: hypothetical protein M1288_03425 [Actinobacteria bacterium]|nr:hypothetical protein [Actinomycetota bacterium]